MSSAVSYIVFLKTLFVKLLFESSSELDRGVYDVFDALHERVVVNELED